jgi:hypothetical protein
MCDNSLSIDEIESLEKILVAVISRAKSLHEIEMWLKSQQGIKSVEVEDYLLKSYPPQRDLIVEFNMKDGSIVTKIVNVYDLGNQNFRFHKIRNQ